jgi:hypothetical protein
VQRRAAAHDPGGPGDVVERLLVAVIAAAHHGRGPARAALGDLEHQHLVGAEAVVQRDGQR